MAESIELSPSAYTIVAWRPLTSQIPTPSKPGQGENTMCPLSQSRQNPLTTLATSESQTTLWDSPTPVMDGSERPSTAHEPVSFSPSEPTSTVPSPQLSFLSRTKKHLNEDICITILVEIELLLLTFCVGIQDAISFPDYHCFASNQTGNTVFLAVALVIPSLNGDTFYTANIAVALGLFLAGGYLTGQLSHLVGPRKRGWLVLCNFFQMLLALAAGFVQYYQLHSHKKVAEQEHGADLRIPPTGPESLITIALLAFASGSQVIQSRSLCMTEISTAMATAAWVDLLIDPHLMAVREPNRPRNRRLAFLVTLVLGSLVGAGIYRTAGSATAVFVSAGGKALVIFMYLFNGTEEKSERQQTNRKIQEKAVV